MKELVDPALVEKLLLFAAVAGPLFGVIIGTVLGAHERCAWPTMLEGALIGALGTVAYGMWKAYGAITNTLGLDSAWNLLAQLVMFAILGAALGVAMFRIKFLLKRLKAGR